MHTTSDSLRFASNSVNTSTMKAAAFDTTFINALSLKNVGGAYGGADFNPYTKSDTEIQVDASPFL